MQDHDKPGGSEHFQQLRAVAHSRAGAVVQEIVAGFGRRTIHAVGSRTRTWPGANLIKPEPIACLEAEHDWNAQPTLRISAISGSLVRQAGKWGEIGEALDLHWEAVVAKEPISEVAYDRRPAPIPPGAPTMAAIRTVVADYDARTDAHR
jgi:hypothetical protein